MRVLFKGVPPPTPPPNYETYMIVGIICFAIVGVVVAILYYKAYVKRLASRTQR